MNAKLEPDEIEEVDPVNSEGPPPGPTRVNLQRVHFTKELLDTIPREIAEQYTVLPVYVRKGKIKKRMPPEPGILYIAASKIDEPGAVEDCSLCSNMKVRVFLADRDEILQAIPVVYAGGQFEPPASQVAPSHATPPRPPPPTKPQVTRSHSFPELPLIRPAAKAPDPASAPVPTPPTPHDPNLAAPATELPTTPHVPTPPTPQQIPPPEVLTHAAPSPQPAPTAGSAPTLTPPAPAPLAPAPLAPAEPAPRPQTQRSFVEEEGPLRLVIVGALPGWLEFCRGAVMSLGAQVEACEMGRTQGLNAGPKPHLLVVPEEIYPFDRRAFNLLGLQLGVPLVVWSLDMDPADLQLLLTASRASRATPPSSRPAVS